MNWLEKYPWSIVEEDAHAYDMNIGSSWFEDLETWCPGWLGIVQEFADRMTNLLNDFAGEKITILDIKEKYGELRFYAATESEDEEFVERFNNLISDLEDAATITCMRCGNTDTARTRERWYLTYCDNCWSQVERR